MCYLHYLQVHRVVIGVPSYTNLYLGKWDLVFFLLSEKASTFMSHIVPWVCYIENIFLVWEGSTNLLHSLAFLKANEYNLKCIMSYSSQKCTFLDVEVEFLPKGTLSCNLYHKPTAGNTILEDRYFFIQAFNKIDSVKPIPKVKKEESG